MKAVFLLFFVAVSAEEVDLSLYEDTVYSQNGEDGVLQRLFQLIPPSTHYCVDIGANDGVTGSNTYLLRSQGWSGLLLDRMYEIPEMNLHKEFITAENMNDLFKKYSVPEDLDLLSIDIDYNDFYVWKALDERYRPAVVVIEHNASHLPDEDRVARYHPYFCGDETNYFGASLLAFYNLARAKSYSLVYVEKRGVNLFFVRDDLLPALGVTFKDINQIERLYRAPSYGLGPRGGHQADPKNRAYDSSVELLKKETSRD